MFFSECKFQTKKEKTVPFKTLGTRVRDAMQSWHILFNPVRVPWPWGPCSPSSAQTRRRSFGQSCACACLPHKCKALPQAGVWAHDGQWCSVWPWATRGSALPLFFLWPEGFFSHLFGLWVPQGRGSSPGHTECSAQRWLSTARKNYCSGEGASASLVRKNTAYFPLKKTPTSKDFNSV